MTMNCQEPSCDTETYSQNYEIKDVAILTGKGFLWGWFSGGLVYKQRPLIC